MLIPVLARKDPDATYPYQVDLSAELADLGDTLDSATVEIVTSAGVVDVASDMSIVSVQITALGKITFWLAGGSTNANGAEKRYYVRVRWKGADITPVQTTDDVTVCIPVGQR